MSVFVSGFVNSGSGVCVLSGFGCLEAELSESNFETHWKLEKEFQNPQQWPNGKRMACGSMEGEILLCCLVKHFGIAQVMSESTSSRGYTKIRDIGSGANSENMNRLTWRKYQFDSISFIHLTFSRALVYCGLCFLSVTFCDFFVMPDEAAMARLFWCRTNSSLRKSENVFRLWGSDRTKRTSSMLWRSLTWAEWTPSRERTEHLGNAAQPWGFVNSSVGVSIFRFFGRDETRIYQTQNRICGVRMRSMRWGCCLPSSILTLCPNLKVDICSTLLSLLSFA